MAAILEKCKRTHKKLMLRSDGDRFVYEGGVPVLTGEAGMELYEPFLNEIGRSTLLRKLEEQSFDEEDMSQAAGFLVSHGIQPTVENTFGLVMGARLYMLFAMGQ